MSAESQIMESERSSPTEMTLLNMVTNVLRDADTAGNLELEAVYGRCKPTRRQGGGPRRRLREPSKPTERLRTAADTCAIERRSQRGWPHNAHDVGYAIECSFDDVQKLRRWLRLCRKHAKKGLLASATVPPLLEAASPRTTTQLDVNLMIEEAQYRITIYEEPEGHQCQTFMRTLNLDDVPALDIMEKTTLANNVHDGAMAAERLSDAPDAHRPVGCHNFYYNLKQEEIVYAKRDGAVTHGRENEHLFSLARTILLHAQQPLTLRWKQRLAYDVRSRVSPERLTYEVAMTAVKTCRTQNGMRGLQEGEESHEIEVELRHAAAESGKTAGGAQNRTTDTKKKKKKKGEKKGEKKGVSSPDADAAIAPESVVHELREVVEFCQRGIYLGEIDPRHVEQVRVLDAQTCQDVLDTYNAAYQDTFGGAGPTADALCCFHGVEPRVVTLSLDTLPTLQQYSDHYRAFVKTDGVRMQGLVCRGALYLFIALANASYAVVHSGVTCADTTAEMLLDGEFYISRRKNQPPCYYVFDAYAHRTTTTCSLLDETLEVRLHTVQQVLDGAVGAQQDGAAAQLHVIVKTPSKMNDVRTMLPQPDDPSAPELRQDGIVFTPNVPICGPHALSMVDAPQELTGSWYALLKWKSRDDNTIDCRLVFEPGRPSGTVWADLFVTYSSGRKSDLYTLLEERAERTAAGRPAPRYSVGGRRTAALALYPGEDVFYPSEPYQHSGRDIVECGRCRLPCNATGTPYFEDDAGKCVHVISGDIVEMRYKLAEGERGGEWQPLRLRRDKKVPNAFDPTALSVWQNVFTAIPAPHDVPNGQEWWCPPHQGAQQQIDCRTRTVDYYKNDKDSLPIYSAMRAVHNKIKSCLFHHVTQLLKERFGSRGEDIVALDVGYGQGGDTLRYHRMGEHLPLRVIGLEHNWGNLHRNHPRNAGAYLRYMTGTDRGYADSGRQRQTEPFAYDGIFLHADCTMHLAESTQPGVAYDQCTNRGFTGRLLTQSALHYDTLQYMCHRRVTRNAILENRLHLDPALHGVLYHGRCQMVSIMFAMHYFFDIWSTTCTKWNNLMSLIHDSLEEGGMLMLTLLCTGDIPALKPLHRADDTLTASEKDELVAYNERLRDVGHFESHGSKGTLLFGAPTIEPSPEHMVSLSIFRTELEKKGFSMRLERSFEQFARVCPDRVKMKLHAVTFRTAPSRVESVFCRLMCADQECGRTETVALSSAAHHHAVFQQELHVPGHDQGRRAPRPDDPLLREHVSPVLEHGVVVEVWGVASGDGRTEIYLGHARSGTLSFDKRSIPLQAADGSPVAQESASLQLSVTWSTAYDDYEQGAPRQRKRPRQAWRADERERVDEVRRYSGKYNHVIIAEKKNHHAAA